MTDEFRWAGATPQGIGLTAAMTTTGWSVTYGGFSRSTSRQLLSALAEATAAQRTDAWLLRLEREILSSQAGTANAM